MADQTPIRVLIVDDHAVVRSGLKSFFSAYDDLECVGEASSGEAALAVCDQVQPDVVLMDLVMPGMDGAETTKAIRARCPSIQVIALTSHKDEELVQGALEAGAIGYLLKDISAEELAKSIRAAKAGQPTLSPEAAQVLIQTTTRKPSIGSDLTSRELDVLTLLVQGHSNPEIAEELVVSRSTVKFHVSSILQKLEVKSRTEAVAYAIQNKLVE